ncbi:non-ribosomal peptide synthetase [Paenibacillus larvae]|uniref:non-ribosomal peptide synthetase n=1 Tax=Paenibacillus larvae TaxID=1464 RepID=UPI000986FE57|nr:non-ribosomal peptide synthetase [Paenibacillus larvae]MCY7490411.1 non-ribosomal peptide synthetase [Paenibacillus larvae]MCY9712240.1 non-ribosomal peptide synthetase [Paenibacillus larvae]
MMTFQKEHVQDIYPLSPMQEGMLFHSLEDTKSGAYFVQVVTSVYGELEPELLMKSFKRLVQRHDVLRTTFLYDNLKEPLQIVLSERPLDMCMKRLDGSSNEIKNEWISQFLKQDREKGFDITMDSLIRLALLETGGGEWTIVLSFHHILMDGWCSDLIFNELFRIYDSLKQGAAVEWSPAQPNSQYIKWLEKQDKEAAARYWKTYLNGYEPMARLPQRKKDASLPYKPMEYRFSVDREVTEQLQRIAQQNQVTLNVLFQTIWGILVQKYNDQHSVVFGSVINGRPAAIPGVEQMIGLFINTLPVRVQTGENQSFQSLLHQMHEQMIQSHEFGFFPLSQIQKESAGGLSLFDHIIVFDHNPVEKRWERTLSGLGLQVTEQRVIEQTNYDFNVVVLPESEMQVQFQYNAHVYDRVSVEQTGKHLIHLMHQIAQNPDRLIEDLSLITEEEQKQILEVFNNTKADYPRDKTIHELFEEQTECVPDQTAIVYEGQQMTYRELNERANQLARTLQAKGVKADQPVGIMVDRSLEMIVGLLGILKAGGAYVPIDPEYPKNRIEYMAADSGTKLLLTQSHLQDRVTFAGTVVNLNEESSYHEERSNLEHIVQPNHLAYVIYTSGTTGKPKGVMVEHRSVVRLVKNTNYVELNRNTRMLQTGTIAFDASIFEIWGAILNSGQLYLTKHEHIMNVSILKRLIQQHSINTMWLTSPLFNQLSQQDSHLFKNVNTLIIGGETLSLSPINQVRRDNPTLKMVNGYGPIENTTFSTTHLIDGEQTHAVPIGRPIRNSTAYVVDQSLHLQPVGVWGELIVGGDGVARGYLNEPKLTAEKFVQCPFIDNERCFRTGDIVRWTDNGSLEFKGRFDNRMKIRVYHIETGEIETALLNIEAVQEAIVLAQENENRDKALCAYYVANQSFEVSEMKEKLSGQLPSYMIPSYFVQLECMPLTPNGKIDRKALPLPDGKLQTGVEYVEPRTPIQKKIAEIWQDILGIEKIGISDNYYQIGGDSVKAIQICARLRKH